MKAIFVLLVGVFAFETSLGFVQPIPHLSESDIKEAIALGQTGKATPYLVGGAKSFFACDPQIQAYGPDGPVFGMITTPFLRIALAANSARDMFKPFSETAITPEILEPVAWVFIPPFKMKGSVVALRHIVLFPIADLCPDDKRDASKATQPLWTKSNLAEYQNLFGAKFEANAMMAGFPMGAINPANIFVLVFDDGTRFARIDADLSKLWR